MRKLRTAPARRWESLIQYFGWLLPSRWAWISIRSFGRGPEEEQQRSEHCSWAGHSPNHTPVHSGCHRLLELAGVIDELSEQRVYDTLRDAVDAATTAST